MQKVKQLFFLIWLILPIISFGKTAIINVSLLKKSDTLYANVFSDIQLTKAIDESIKNGFTLEFSYEFNIVKPQWYKIRSFANISKNYLLSYQHITSEYRLVNPVTFEAKTFKKMDAVIDSLNTLQQFPLIPIAQLPDEKVVLKVRFRLNSQNLPILLRLENMIDSDWDIDSDWVIWPIS